VDVRKGEVTIALDRKAFHQAVGFADSDDTEASEPSHDTPIEISVPAQALRCGKQVRMVVGEVSTERRAVNPDLVRLITDAARWFEDLRTGKVDTIGDIARRDHVSVAHVSRTLPLAFLSPDIVEMILTRQQPATLTPDRLKRRQSLPIAWSEQRTKLLI
jgi:site-specific DNA recombinase